MAQTTESLLGNHHALVWTPEHDKELRRLREEGYSYYRIAAELNEQFATKYSRNAAIGRASRIGGMVHCAPAAPRIFKTRIRKDNIQPRIRHRPTVLPSEIIQLQCAEVVTRDISLADLEPNDCRYPVGDGPFLFCGHPKMEGSSYCVPHFHLCRHNGTSERAALKISARKLEAA